MKKNRHSLVHKGFTFVEMALVLTIVGLIVAAVMVGQHVADAARLKAMISEVQTLKTSVGQFQSLYNGLPGDVADATDYWGSDTTNGNSNGRIAGESSNEAFAALDQLSLAGFIDGSYSGVWGSAFSPDGNVIESKLGRGAMVYINCCGGDEADSSLAFINRVVVFSGASSNAQRAGVVTPEEAKGIDVKMDDGNPDAGEIGAMGGYVTSDYTKTNCFTGSGSGAAYDITNEDTGCQMYFGYNWE